MATIKSIEEKAKRYDEAKERMKNFLKEWEDCGAIGEAMEKARNVFPELKVSEDERINKKIEEYTTQGNCPHYDENASVCDDGECGCAECISRIKRCEKNSIKPDKK